MTPDELEASLRKHDPAHPVMYEMGDTVVARPGLSRRDYFAAAALTGMVFRNGTGESEPLTYTEIAESSYKYADAMLAAGKAGP